MRILLVQPPKPHVAIGGDDVFIYEPLALEYLAAGICEEHDVRILDLRFDENFIDTVSTFQPQVVGISAYTIHVNVVRKLFEVVKGLNEDILTVVGGHHATVRPTDFITPFIDAIVIGEGVFVFREIIARFERSVPLTGIPGTFSPDLNGESPWSCQTPIDLDALPFPARNYTAKYRSRYYADWMKPLASIRTSKGCPYRCNFCALWKIAEGQYWKREPERVVEELAEIEEECVFFADDESLVDAPRMARLADLIREAGIKKRIFLYGRSDTVARNRALLKKWKDIGLERVFIGLESFRDEDLNTYKKRSSIEQNAKAVQVLQDLGIEIVASFIVQPSYTREDFASLRKYCRTLNLNYASYAVLTPLPGTDLMKEVEADLISDNYDCFDFLHTLLPTTLPLETFFSELLKLYKTGIPRRKQVALLRRYPLRDIPDLSRKVRKFYKGLETAHLDYQD